MGSTIFSFLPVLVPFCWALRLLLVISYLLGKTVAVMRITALPPPPWLLLECYHWVAGDLVVTQMPAKTGKIPLLCNALQEGDPKIFPYLLNLAKQRVLLIEIILFFQSFLLSNYLAFLKISLWLALAQVLGLHFFKILKTILRDKCDFPILYIKNPRSESKCWIASSYMVWFKARLVGSCSRCWPCNWVHFTLLTIPSSSRYDSVNCSLPGDYDSPYSYQ